MYALDANIGISIGNSKRTDQSFLLQRLLMAASTLPLKNQIRAPSTSSTQHRALWFGNKQLPYEYQFTGGTEMLGSPSVADGMVFASSDLRTYYGINAQQAKLLDVSGTPMPWNSSLHRPIYVNGQLYIIDKFSITSLNATNGKQLELLHRRRTVHFALLR